MSRLHIPLTPIQEDVNSSEEDDEAKQHGEDEMHVRFMLGPHAADDNEALSKPQLPPFQLRPPPRPEAYHNHHNHLYHQQPYLHQPYHPRLHWQQTNHLPRHEEKVKDGVAKDEEGEPVSEALVQYVHNRTEAMMLEEQERLRGRKPGGSAQRDTPKDYLWLAVLSCFGCCPLGTAALWYSRNVRHYTKCGDLVAAKKHSKKALGVSILALVCDVIVIVVVIIVRFGGILFGDLKFSWE